jgi:prepilin-type N-terminal cleavage/methylation domain-containing protein
MTYLKRRGFTLVEMLVVIAIISILMALAVTGIQRVLAAGRKGACTSNLKQLYTAASNYGQDHGGRLPSAASQLWTEKMLGEGVDDNGDPEEIILEEKTHQGWVGWSDIEDEHRTFWWGEEGLQCITNGTLFSYVGGPGSEKVYVCPEHARLARKYGLKNCSGKKLAGVAAGNVNAPTLHVKATRSYGMNARMNRRRSIQLGGAPRTMLFAEQAFESQHPDFERGYALRYVSITKNATDEWNDNEPELVPNDDDDDDAESPTIKYSQRFYRSWDGCIDYGGTNNWKESIGEMHSRNYKRPDGTISRQGLAVFMDGHVESVDIRNTAFIATGKWDN